MIFDLSQVIEGPKMPSSGQPTTTKIEPTRLLSIVQLRVIVQLLLLLGWAFKNQESSYSSSSKLAS
jgi:hypothetical protein